MSSILTFSNRSVKLFTLKNRFLITAKVLHSIRICLTVQVVWQVKHCGCGSCFKIKEWVSLVWPIRNRDITTCSLLDFLVDGLHSPKVGWIWKSLLWMLLLHCCCHFVWRNLLIVGFRSGHNYNLLLTKDKLFMKIDIYIYIYYIYIYHYHHHHGRAACTDILDPLSPRLPIIHRLRQVFGVTSHIIT